MPFAKHIDKKWDSLYLIRGIPVQCWQWKGGLCVYLPFDECELDQPLGCHKKGRHCVYDRRERTLSSGWRRSGQGRSIVYTTAGRGHSGLGDGCLVKGGADWACGQRLDIQLITEYSPLLFKYNVNPSVCLFRSILLLGWVWNEVDHTNPQGHKQLWILIICKYFICRSYF